MSTSSSVLLPPGGQSVLVVIAHPDDKEQEYQAIRLKTTALKHS